MHGRYFPALVDAALASVKYRSFRCIYEQALFVGPWTELPDGSLVRTGDDRWSRSTEDARFFLAKILRDESFFRFINTCQRVSSDCLQVVNGEAAGDVATRVAYAKARDGLVVALHHLAQASLREGRDPRTSALYESLDLRHELLALLDSPAHDTQNRDIETFCKAADDLEPGRLLPWVGNDGLGLLGLCVLATHPDTEVGEVGSLDTVGTTKMVRE
ncbi:hypothetical protein [Pseudomonas chlororaphis]